MIIKTDIFTLHSVKTQQKKSVNVLIHCHKMITVTHFSGLSQYDSRLEQQGSLVVSHHHKTGQSHCQQHSLELDHTH